MDNRAECERLIAETVGEDPTLRAPLLLLESDLEERLGRGTFGQWLAWERLARVLRSRSAVRASRRFDHTRIEVGLVIAGMPRTGTTFLHHMLGLDVRNSVLKYWQGLRPELALDEPRGLAAAHSHLQALTRLAPNLRLVHPLEVDSPDECLGLLALDFVDYLADIEMFLPAYSEWLWTNSRQAAACARAHMILNGVVDADWNRRWVLKSPFHSLDIAGCIASSPQALVVAIDRDPDDCLASFAGLVMHARIAYGYRTDIAQTLAEWSPKLAKIGKGWLEIEARSGVFIAGELSKLATDDAALETVLDALNKVAMRVVDTRADLRCSTPLGALTVSTSPQANARLTGPPFSEPGRLRLDGRIRTKFQQTQRSGATWLHISAQDGLWQFSTFGATSLYDKARAVAQLVRRLAYDGGITHLRGVVVSSGVLMDQSGTRDGSARPQRNVFGLRRALPFGRVQESIVVGLSAETDEARLWVDLLDAEPGWVDGALHDAGLVSRDAAHPSTRLGFANARTLP